MTQKRAHSARSRPGEEISHRWWGPLGRERTVGFGRIGLGRIVIRSIGCWFAQATIENATLVMVDTALAGLPAPVVLTR